MQKNAPSGPEKKKQAKRSKKAKNEANTKHPARNLPRFTAKSPKRNAAISRLDEGHRGQKNEQKAKKARKAHESRFGLDQGMMDALPEMPANSSNPSPKRRLQSAEAQQVAENSSSSISGSGNSCRREGGGGGSFRGSGLGGADEIDCSWLIAF